MNPKTGSFVFPTVFPLSVMLNFIDETYFASPVFCFVDIPTYIGKKFIDFAVSRLFGLSLPKDNDLYSVYFVLQCAAPDASLYNAVIQGMCLRGNTELAKKLYAKMRESGLQPDGKTRAMMLQNLQRRKKKPQPSRYKTSNKFSYIRR